MGCIEVCKKISTCIGLVPWGAALAWAILIPAQILIAIGGDAVLNPLCPWACDKIRAVIDICHAMYSIMGLLLTERLLAMKLSLRLPRHCRGPCYAKCKKLSLVTDLYHRILLAVTWVNVGLALFLGALLICGAMVVLVVAFCFRVALQTAGTVSPLIVDGMVEALNSPPISAGERARHVALALC